MEHKLLFFDDFGRELLKKYRIPIDMFIQVALQVAYYKIHRRYAHNIYSDSSASIIQTGSKATVLNFIVYRFFLLR